LKTALKRFSRVGFNNPGYERKVGPSKISHPLYNCRNVLCFRLLLLGGKKKTIKSVEEIKHLSQTRLVDGPGPQQSVLQDDLFLKGNN